MPRPALRRRLSRVVTAGVAVLATANVSAIFLPDRASADDVFNCFGTPFSEATYLSRYADVRAAVEAGAFPSGCAHFPAHGHAEGRSGTPDGWTAPSEGPTNSPTQDPGGAKPRAAVALGDSFISGEGAGDYQPVRDRFGNDSGFPGWDAENKKAHFCHRSANASLHRASLDGIDVRFNLACSGGQPADIRNESDARPEGREVASQRDQLRQVAQGNDIDLVLIGLGSNNRTFDFGDLAKECVGGFLSDGFFGRNERPLRLLSTITDCGPPPRQGDCSTGIFPGEGSIDSAERETYNALRDIVETLRSVDADGDHRIVLQDYTNPLPFELAQPFHSERSAGRFDLGTGNNSDTDAKFRGLASERYEAGCPIHRSSLGPATSSRSVSAAWSGATPTGCVASSRTRGSCTSTSRTPSTAPGSASSPTPPAGRWPLRSA